MLWESGCGQFSFQLLISSQCVGDWFNNRVDKIQSLELDLWICPYIYGLLFASEQCGLGCKEVVLRL